MFSLSELGPAPAAELPPVVPGAAVIAARAPSPAASSAGPGRRRDHHGGSNRPDVYSPACGFGGRLGSISRRWDDGSRGRAS